jgi:hypothetical protein
MDGDGVADDGLCEGSGDKGQCGRAAAKIAPGDSTGQAWRNDPTCCSFLNMKVMKAMKFMKGCG